MRLPVIKHINNFIEEENAESVEKTISTLESIAEIPSMKEAELDVIGELLSNLYGAMEVHSEIEKGVPQKEALNGFMKRVMGSIDR